MDSKCSIDPAKVSDSIEPFFTKEELDKMSAYEKKYLQNLRSNYEALKMIGKNLISLLSKVLKEL